MANNWDTPWTDGATAPRRPRQLVDAERIARDGLTPVDISGGTTTAETRLREHDQAAATKLRALTGALDGPRPAIATALAQNRAQPNAGSFLAAVTEWRERNARKVAVEAEAFKKGRKKYAKRLLKGASVEEARAAGFVRYRALGGQMTPREWASR